ncbi:hypothetical protein DsansV1_C10g0103541 [Dioscorea sansibarensis]
MESPLSSDELEASDVLLSLSQLFIIKPEPKPRHGYFGILPRWGLRKPRSIPFDKPSDPSPAPESKEPIPEPNPPAQPAASSPSTPMSFPATSEEAEPNLVNPKKPSPSSLSFKIHRQWIKEQNEKIALLSASRVDLQRLDASRGNHVRIEALNSWLNNISFQLKQRSRKRRNVTIEKAVHPMNGSDLVSVDRHHPINGCDDANNNHRKRVLLCLPDLNMSAEEVDRWERAAASAQARKRRRDICKQKGSSAGGALPRRPRIR